MTYLTPHGTSRQRFLGTSAEDAAARPAVEAREEDFDAVCLAYLGWEMARSVPGLTPVDSRAIALLASMCLTALQAGSTRVSLDDARLARALEASGAADMISAVKSVLARARAALPADPVTQVLGRSADRKPMVLEGDWLYTERMRALEERFCRRVVERLASPLPARDGRSLGRAVAAVVGGPPPLTEEQGRAVRAALTSPLAIISGGPGTGKTTIVVAILRALAWMGFPLESVAVAAPTGKAAQRLQHAITTGLASAPRDIAEAGLRFIAPAPQTLHRLLGWSP
ncbi:MAG: AAA family ATPase, partial [Myxococcota bacterium]|nr:AAA family ATPase [Myxococcota bacterium]